MVEAPDVHLLLTCRGNTYYSLTTKIRSERNFLEDFCSILLEGLMFFLKKNRHSRS
jgi:hypothetical protein